MALRSGTKMMVLVSGFVAVTLLAGSQSASAASSAVSLCRSALLTPPTQEQINITLDGLARLTLEVDLAKSKSTETNTQLEADLKLKQNEVMTALSLDRAGLRKLLHPRIQELQKIEKSSTKESTRRRQTEKKNLGEIPIFKKVQDVELPLINIKKVLSANLPEITYVANTNGYVALYTSNIATKKGGWISGLLYAANISANKKSIYGINSTFDILQFEPGVIDPVKPPIKIKDVNNQPWKKIEEWESVQLGVSPGEQFLALHIGSVMGELFIIRIADGEVVHHQATGYQFGVKFRNDEEIYIYDSSSITKYNLSTQQEVKTEKLPPRATVNGLWLDPTGKNLIHSTNVKTTTLDANTLKVKSSQEMSRNIYPQMLIPNSDRYYLAFSHTLPEIFDSREKTQQAHFSFEDTAALNAGATNDGNSILFFNNKNSALQLSIWAREK